MIRRLPSFLYLLGFLSLSDCSLFSKNNAEDALARAGDNYLYEEEVLASMPKGLGVADSTQWVRSYINDWAREQLFLQKAELNLSSERQQLLNDLIDQYHDDIYIKVYKEALVSASVDTAVAKEEIEKMYEDSKENFILNEDLLKLRYVSVGKQYYNLSELKRRLKDFSEDDKQYLDSIALQFKSFSLNDSVWVKASQVYQRIPSLGRQPTGNNLKKSQFITLEDSLDIYLVHISDVLSSGSQAPLAYVMPTVRQIMLNKRKLNYLKQLDKDILDDAIKNKQFEIYE